ncbi:hypothetical protein FXO37_04359 [Capsicum annuum]|nr:hypothetical protein FXO37_04359 [Capsicum annuum]
MISKILFSKNPRNLSLSFQDHKKRSQMWIPYFNLSNLRSRPHPQGQESQETDQDPGSIYQDSGSTFQIKQPKFLPSRKVMEKTQKLRSNLTREMLSGTTFTNILTMTFRQVTLQHLWNFDTFIPEVERNMDDLETLREVLRDSDRLSSVIPFLSAEIFFRKGQLQTKGGKMDGQLVNFKYILQTGGPEFISWLSEYVPAYKLLIDADKLGNVKFEGWKETTTNTLEIFLTHFQMMSIHFPTRNCHQVLLQNLSSISMSKEISMVLASAVFLVAIRILGQRYLPHRPINQYPVSISLWNLARYEFISSSSFVSFKFIFD